MAEQPLRCEGIEFRIGGLSILDGIDFAVEAGEVCAIVGPNGSGKSTFLNVVSGFVKPDRGVVRLDGVDVTSLPPWRRARLGLGRTFQIVRLVETAMAIENVEVGLLVGREGRKLPRLRLRANAERRTRMRRALERVHAEEFADWPVRYLSGGTRRKVEVARGIAAGPKVILVDEPTAGVSVAHILEMERALLDEAARGVAIVVVDHNLDFVGRISSRVVVFDAGKQIFEGSPADAFADERVIEAYVGV
jgi:branched-chain amino acid transport system ATP-binding protein